VRLFRFATPSGPHLGLELGDALYDATALVPDVLGSMAQWLRHDHPLLVARLAGERARSATPLVTEVELLAPVDSQEVWASGVTYERSKVARMEESEGGGDFYDRVYDAERPELFFKAAPWRVVPPGGSVRIRRDSTWDVPEPELTLVLSSRGELIGVTTGNDMSSRSIEGENPLYLPQAKTYDGSCALSPMIRLIDDTLDLSSLDIALTIRRAGSVAFNAVTSTSRMKRTPQELAGFLFRETSFPDGALLMTGTGIVPPDSFTLRSGDEIEIDISGVATLINAVAPA
jgi:2-dehydro-3-deoxy-D-arabinonate dehydratase